MSGINAVNVYREEHRRSDRILPSSSIYTGSFGHFEGDEYESITHILSEVQGMDGFLNARDLTEMAHRTLVNLELRSLDLDGGIDDLIVISDFKGDGKTRRQSFREGDVKHTFIRLDLREWQLERFRRALMNMEMGGRVITFY